MLLFFCLNYEKHVETFILVEYEVGSEIKSNTNEFTHTVDENQN